VGFSPKSPHQLRIADIEWSDLILVMEDGHKNRIRGTNRDLDLPKVEVLSIEDEYEYMDEEFIELIETGLNDYLRIFGKI